MAVTSDMKVTLRVVDSLYYIEYLYIQSKALLALSTTSKVSFDLAW